MSTMPSATGGSGSSSTPPEVMMSGDPPAWPKVVGIISTVWGSIGVICNGCGVISAFAGPAMMNMVPPEQRAQMAQQPQPGPLQILLYVLGIGLSAFLIASGVMTLKRRPVGRVMHLFYGVVAILLGIVSMIVGWGTFQTQMQAMANDPKQAAALPMARTMGYVMFGFFGCIGFAYPIFCLIWFGALKRRPDAMMAGQEEPLV